MGVTAGDYDEDGWPDLYVTNFGPNVLYRNNGDGTFTELASQAGVNETTTTIGDGFGSTFGDFDLDGDLDLFVTSWHKGVMGNRLFENNGAGSFHDATEIAILADLSSLRGFAPRFADMNGDRYPELLIAGDFFTSRYFVNQSDGTFIDKTTESGTWVASNGMGSAIGDLNGEGLLDWYGTSIGGGDQSQVNTGNVLFMCLGNHAYDEVAKDVGVAAGGWGWGTDIQDFDNDGDLDIVETNGMSGPGFVNQQMYYWRNNGDMTFVEEALALGLDWPSKGKGLVTLDYDRDGDRDIAVMSNNEPFKLFRNDLSGPGTNWLKVVLDRGGDPDVAPNGFGTRVKIFLDGVPQSQFLDGGETYLGQSELALHFGLGDAEVVDKVVVRWASGQQTVLSDVAANQEILIEACGADVNDDGDLSILDFIAFQGMFQSGDPGADCNGDGALNVLDFSCFQSLFVGGCQ